MTHLLSRALSYHPLIDINLKPQFKRNLTLNQTPIKNISISCHQVGIQKGKFMGNKKEITMDIKSFL